MHYRNFQLIEALEPRIVLGSAAVDPLTALLAKLDEFAGQKTTPPAVPTPAKAYSLITAKADDLVYAVYQLTKTTNFDQASEITNLVTTALEARPPSGSSILKVRADKDKIAPRILSAALLGSGLTAAADVSDITSAIANVNSSLAGKALTAAGKEAVIGQALKITSGVDPAMAIGAALAPLANILSLTLTGNAAAASKLQTFTIAALKGVGTATGQVKNFVDAILENVTGTVARDAFALKVAEGVATVSVAAGEVIGGRAQDVATDAGVLSITQQAIKDTKLAKTIPYVVGSAAEELVGTTLDQFTTDLVGTNGLGTKATAVNRGLVAAGAIQNIPVDQNSASKVGSVINSSLTGRTLPTPFLTKAELSTYAGAASTATGALAGDVVTTVVNKSYFVTPLPDLTVVKNIGIAALKAIATTTPNAGKVIGQKLVVAGGTLFDTDSQKTDLAKALAKGVSTSVATAGAAVAGVGTTLNSDAPTVPGLATFTAAVIPSATKAALNIAKEVSALGQVTDYDDFALKVVQTAGFSVNNAASVAAGVAVTAAAGSAGQSPGEIAVAVANGSAVNPASAALKKKTATIAGTVALAVDVERIADTGAKVGLLYQNAIPADANLPKLSTMGTLATSLAKAINTKPLTGTANRVDELGELAAELTRAAIIKLGVNAPAALLASTISTIGTSVMKGLSAALLINGGPFAADLKDSARDLAGAIAQTISFIGADNTVITAANVEALIKDDGALAKALAKAAKKFAPEVNGIVTTANPLGGAFGEVRLAMGNSRRLVSGSEELGVGEVPLDGTSPVYGKYEVGSLIDSETPTITSLP